MRFTLFRCRISNAAAFRSSERATTLYFSAARWGRKIDPRPETAEAENAVLISEDEWLEMLYPEQIRTLDDYLHYSAD